MESPEIPPQNDMHTRAWLKGGREKSNLALILAWVVHKVYNLVRVPLLL